MNYFQFSIQMTKLCWGSQNNWCFCLSDVLLTALI